MNLYKKLIILSRILIIFYLLQILVSLQDDCSAKKLRLATKFDEVLGNTGIISNF